MEKIININSCDKTPENFFPGFITSIKHYTDRLFKFRITRNKNFRFRSGQFVMLGIANSEIPLYRAYSIASPFWDDELEFFSIKVSGGLFTESLQNIKVNDKIFVSKKSTGTLVLDALLPGIKLYLLSSGTGIAPFTSIIRDPETYKKFKQIILVQTVRETPELKYANEVVDHLHRDPLIGEFSKNLIFYPMTTRMKSVNTGRITDFIRSGRFFSDIGFKEFNHQKDRIMICGSSSMLKDCCEIIESLGFFEGSNSIPGTYIIERAFVS